MTSGSGDTCSRPLAPSSDLCESAATKLQHNMLFLNRPSDKNGTTEQRRRNLWTPTSIALVQHTSTCTGGCITFWDATAD